jgi:hypothetical protein
MRRFSPDEIRFIPPKIVKTLVTAGHMTVDEEPRVIEGIASVITEELMVEDRLNEEARQVLSEHSAHLEHSDSASRRCSRRPTSSPATCA